MTGESTTYVVLLDPEHKGTVVKTVGQSSYKHVKGKGWVETGVMMRYYWPDDPIYDRFRDIDEAEAFRLINN